MENVPSLPHQISQKLYNNSKTKKIGVIIAGIDPAVPTRVLIGYCLCHSNDQYDWVREGGGKRYQKGFGVGISIMRAIKWKNEKMIECPPSILPEISDFCKRCQTYYKDKRLPEWTEVVLETPVVFKHIAARKFEERVAQWETYE